MAKIRFGHKHNLLPIGLQECLPYYVIGHFVCMCLPCLLNSIVKFLKELKISFNVFFFFNIYAGTWNKTTLTLCLEPLPRSGVIFMLGV